MTSANPQNAVIGSGQPTALSGSVDGQDPAPDSPVGAEPVPTAGRSDGQRSSRAARRRFRYTLPGAWVAYCSRACRSVRRWCPAPVRSKVWSVASPQRSGTASGFSAPGYGGSSPIDRNAPRRSALGTAPGCSMSSHCQRPPSERNRRCTSSDTSAIEKRRIRTKSERLLFPLRWQ